MKAHAGKCDLILNTVSANHDINTYIPLLAKGKGVLVQLGGVTSPHGVQQFPLMMGMYVQSFIKDRFEWGFFFRTELATGFFSVVAAIREGSCPG